MPESFEELVERFAPTRDTVSSNDLPVMMQVAEVARSYLLSEAKKSATAAERRPVLMVYGGDLTPMVNKFRQTFKGPDLRITREGGKNCEWNLHKGFTIWKADDDSWISKCFFDPPVLMTGKKTWHLYAAAERLCPLLMLIHQFGISITWYIFDRGCRGPLSRVLRRRHGREIANEANLDVRFMKNMLDWPCDSACFDHDVQGGARWGCTLTMTDKKGAFKDIFKAIRSIRQCLADLMASLPEWVLTLEWDEEPFDEVEVEKAWQWSGASEELCKKAAACNIRFERNALRCASTALTSGDEGLAYVMGIIMGLYRFIGFSDTRFMRMTTSSQGLMTGWMIGLDKHIAWLRSRGRTSEWYIHNYDLLQAEQRELVVKAALGSRPASVLLKAVLKDDRLAKDPDKYLSIMPKVMDELSHDVPMLLYERLASHIEGAEAEFLQSAVLRASYGAYAYIDIRSFTTLRSEFTRMCSGDIRAKVDALIANPVVPQHPILAKAHTLGRTLGYPPELLCQAFETLAEAPWSIILEEQMHGVGSVQHQHHKGYGPMTHSTKAMSCLVRPLVRNATRRPKQTKEDRRIAFLAKRQPEKAGAAGYQLGQKVKEACAKKKEVPGTSAKELFETAQTAVINSHIDFKKKRRSEVAALDAGARCTKLQRRAAINSEMDKLQVVSDLKHKKRAAEEKAKPLFLASKCGWTPEDLEELNKMMTQDMFRQAEVKQLRKVSLYSPPIPTREDREDLQQYDEPEPVGLGDVPEWVATVCRHRKIFATVAFIFGEPPECFTLSLGHASESPFWAAFFPLEYAPPPPLPPPADPAEGGLALAPAGPDYTWDARYLETITHDDARLHAPPLYIIPTLIFCGGDIGISWKAPRSWANFCAALPPVRVKTEKRKKPCTLDEDDTVEHMHPYIRKVLTEKKQREGKAKLGGAPAGGAPTRGAKKPGEPTSEEEELDEEQRERNAEKLEEARLEVKGAGRGCPDFVIEPRGGDNTYAKCGLAVNSYRCRPSAGLATEFMTKFFRWGERSVTLSIIKKFTVRDAIALCEAWGCVMQAFFSTYSESDDGDGVVFDAVDVCDVCDKLFVEQVLRLPEGHPTREKFDSFRLVWPVLQ